MVDLRFDVETQPSFAQRAIAAIPRVAFGLGFVVLGMTKFDPSSAWVKLFNQIGFGSWFRYLAGAMQIAGGLLMIVPVTVIAGAVLISCTMAGAVLVDLFVLNVGPGAIVPFILFVVAVGFGWQSWMNRSIGG
jgi:putative oxidoreductase